MEFVGVEPFQHVAVLIRVLRLSSPHTVKTIHAVIPGFRAPKNINEVLKEGGEDDSKVESLIWRYSALYLPLIAC